MAYPPPYTPYDKSGGPPQYPPHGRTVIVQPTTNVVHRSNRGLFGSLDQIGKSISSAFDYTAKEITKAADTHWKGPLLDIFQTQNVVQLVSRSSGKTLQIVTSPQGRLVVDGLGGFGEAACNAFWTVVNEGSNQVRLHNNNNYLAVVNKETILITVPPGTQMGVETKFQLSTLDLHQFVTLESLNCTGCHIGILPSGELKSAMVTRKEMHAHFGVKLMYSPYPHQSK